jgi:Uma2 family endonuclease
VRTIVSDPPPPEFQELLERRREWGADRHDEIWDGVHRVLPVPGEAHWLIDQQLAELLGPFARAAGLICGPEFNLGDKNDFRVPDRGLHRPEITGDWRPTAALVVEILSPGDETPAKLPFYASHAVDELVIVDPRSRTVEWLALEQDQYRPIDHSRLIPLGPAELAALIDWPAVEPERR